LDWYFATISNPKPKKFKSILNYKLVSFFALSNVSNLSLYLHNHIYNNSSSQLKGTFRASKILVKQSYILLVWLSSVLRTNRFKNNFAFLPKKRSLQTLLKAPMAHKTFSQEQFNFSYTPITITLIINNTLPSNIPLTCYLVSLIRENNLSIGTNLLFIIRVRNSFLSKDLTYFKLN
jgi:hypothetical protein